MSPFVILRHDLPAGTGHYDLLLVNRDAPKSSAQRDPNDRCLLAFRCDTRPDLMVIGGEAVEFERLPDHRWLYMTYEGPVPTPERSSETGDSMGDRGRVRREAWGEASIQHGVSDGGRGGGELMDITLVMGGGVAGVEAGRRVRLHVTSIWKKTGIVWRFRVVDPL